MTFDRIKKQKFAQNTLTGWQGRASNIQFLTQYLNTWEENRSHSITFNLKVHSAPKNQFLLHCFDWKNIVEDFSYAFRYN